MHTASGHLFLSPTVRLLADAPAPAGPSSGTLDAHTCEYDGQGHCLVLPGKEHLGELAWDSRHSARSVTILLAATLQSACWPASWP